MKHYENLPEKGYFTREQLIEVAGTEKSVDKCVYMAYNISRNIYHKIYIAGYLCKGEYYAT